MGKSKWKTKSQGARWTNFEMGLEEYKSKMSAGWWDNWTPDSAFVPTVTKKQKRKFQMDEIVRKYKELERQKRNEETSKAESMQNTQISKEENCLIKGQPNTKPTSTVIINEDKKLLPKKIKGTDAQYPIDQHKKPEKEIMKQDQKDKDRSQKQKKENKSRPNDLSKKMETVDKKITDTKVVSTTLKEEQPSERHEHNKTFVSETEIVKKENIQKGFKIETKCDEKVDKPKENLIKKDTKIVEINLNENDKKLLPGVYTKKESQEKKLPNMAPKQQQAHGNFQTFSSERVPLPVEIPTPPPPVKQVTGLPESHKDYKEAKDLSKNYIPVSSQLSQNTKYVPDKLIAEKLAPIVAGNQTKLSETTGLFQEPSHSMIKNESEAVLKSNTNDFKDLDKSVNLTPKTDSIQQIVEMKDNKIEVKQEPSVITPNVPLQQKVIREDPTVVVKQNTISPEKEKLKKNETDQNTKLSTVKKEKKSLINKPLPEKTKFEKEQKDAKEHTTAAVKQESISTDKYNVTKDETDKNTKSSPIKKEGISLINEPLPEKTQFEKEQKDSKEHTTVAVKQEIISTDKSNVTKNDTDKNTKSSTIKKEQISLINKPSSQKTQFGKEQKDSKEHPTVAVKQESISTDKSKVTINETDIKTKLSPIKKGQISLINEPLPEKTHFEKEQKDSKEHTTVAVKQESISTDKSNVTKNETDKNTKSSPIKKEEISLINETLPGKTQFEKEQKDSKEHTNVAVKQESISTDKSNVTKNETDKNTKSSPIKKEKISLINETLPENRQFEKEQKDSKENRTVAVKQENISPDKNCFKQNEMDRNTKSPPIKKEKISLINKPLPEITQFETEDKHESIYQTTITSIVPEQMDNLISSLPIQLSDISENNLPANQKYSDITQCVLPPTKCQTSVKQLPDLGQNIAYQTPVSVDNASIEQISVTKSLQLHKINSNISESKENKDSLVAEEIKVKALDASLSYESKDILTSSISENNDNISNLPLIISDENLIKIENKNIESLPLETFPILKIVTTEKEITKEEITDHADVNQAIGTTAPKLLQSTQVTDKPVQMKSQEIMDKEKVALKLPGQQKFTMTEKRQRRQTKSGEKEIVLQEKEKPKVTEKDQTEGKELSKISSREKELPMHQMEHVPQKISSITSPQTKEAVILPTKTSPLVKKPPTTTKHIPQEKEAFKSSANLLSQEKEMATIHTENFPQDKHKKDSISSSITTSQDSNVVNISLDTATSQPFAEMETSNQKKKCLSENDTASYKKTAKLPKETCEQNKEILNVPAKNLKLGKDVSKYSTGTQQKENNAFKFSPEICPKEKSVLNPASKFSSEDKQFKLSTKSHAQEREEPTHFDGIPIIDKSVTEQPSKLKHTVETHKSEKEAANLSSDILSPEKVVVSKTTMKSSQKEEDSKSSEEIPLKDKTMKKLSPKEKINPKIPSKRSLPDTDVCQISSNRFPSKKGANTSTKDATQHKENQKHQANTAPQADKEIPQFLAKSSLNDKELFKLSAESASANINTSKSQQNIGHKKEISELPTEITTQEKMLKPSAKLKKKNQDHPFAQRNIGETDLKIKDKDAMCQKEDKSDIRTSEDNKKQSMKKVDMIKTPSKLSKNELKMKIPRQQKGQTTGQQDKGPKERKQSSKTDKSLITTSPNAADKSENLEEASLKQLSDRNDQNKETFSELTSASEDIKLTNKQPQTQQVINKTPLAKSEPKGKKARRRSKRESESDKEMQSHNKGTAIQISKEPIQNVKQVLDQTDKDEPLEKSETVRKEEIIQSEKENHSDNTKLPIQNINLSEKITPTRAESSPPNIDETTKTKVNEQKNFTGSRAETVHPVINKESLQTKQDSPILRREPFNYDNVRQSQPAINTERPIMPIRQGSSISPSPPIFKVKPTGQGIMPSQLTSQIPFGIPISQPITGQAIPPQYQPGTHYHHGPNTAQHQQGQNVVQYPHSPTTMQYNQGPNTNPIPMSRGISPSSPFSPGQGLPPYFQSGQSSQQPFITQMFGQPPPMGRSPLQQGSGMSQITAQQTTFLTQGDNDEDLQVPALFDHFM